MDPELRDKIGALAQERLHDDPEWAALFARIPDLRLGWAGPSPAVAESSGPLTSVMVDAFVCDKWPFAGSKDQYSVILDEDLAKRPAHRYRQRIVMVRHSPSC